MSQETITPDHSLLDQIEAAGPLQTPLLPKTIKGKKEVRKLLAQPNPDKPEPKKN